MINKLQEVFRKVFEQPKLVIDSTSSAASIPMWDSLSHMQLITQIEQEFKVEFLLDEVMNFSCVGDMLTCIDKKISSSPQV